ncbi:hypothetical protein sos41_02530 [Alphaproteobacteria bacterium SO-S41]|nr:hypothetical protein sos41_02530 [Alphaproteobacteria bacterium SO-S41]
MDHDSHGEDGAEPENYFISMTDMMVGLVFLFVIMLMYFALQYRQTTDELTSADRTRREILEEVAATLKRQGVPVEIDPDNGILRLPDSILFDQGREELKPAGEDAVRKVAEAFWAILPCYAELPTTEIAAPLTCAAGNKHRIEAVFIEGHTDDKPMDGPQGNWGLAANRAINTFKILELQRPELADLCAARTDGVCIPVLGVAGYADKRPVHPRPPCDSQGAEAPQDCATLLNDWRANNRRIDIRILMQAPLDPTVREPVEERLRGTN